MAQWSLSVEEGKLVSLLRDYDRRYSEFTITVAGFQRSGKRVWSLRPQYTEYLESDKPLSLAIDD